MSRFARRPRRILLIRQDRLGDVVLSTALPREIRRRWPDAGVSVMVRPYAAAVYANNPHVDEILLDDPPVEATARRRSFWRLVAELRRRRFSHALMLLPQKRYNYACFCAGIPVRVGVGAILYHLITGTRFVMRHKYRENRHEADFSMDLARKVGVQGGDFTPEIHLDAQERERVDELRAEMAGARPLVGVHVGSGGSAPNWTPEVYREFIEDLSRNSDTVIAVTDDRVPPEVDGIPGVLYPNRDRDLRGAMLHFAALDLLVSASTGPMHVCGALGVATLSLFCPLDSCAPERWRPLGNDAEILLPEPAFCANRCPGDPHLCRFEGSSRLGIESVRELVLRKLAAGPSFGSRNPAR